MTSRAGTPTRLEFTDWNIREKRKPRHLTPARGRTREELDGGGDDHG